MGDSIRVNLSETVLRANLGQWYSQLIEAGYSYEEIRDACQLKLDDQVGTSLIEGILLGDGS